MQANTVQEVSEIISMFDLDEIDKMLDKQINIADGDMDISLHTVDYFKPLYFKYKQLIDSTDVEELKTNAEERFDKVNGIFLQKICNKFQLKIDDYWKDDHYRDLPGFTLALYSFFVIDLSSNIYDVCLKFIQDKKDYVYKTFEDRKTKKDSATLINKKILSPDMAVIVSNIYDVTTWILSQLSEEQYFQYLDQDYSPLKIIYPLFSQGLISGEFMDEIGEIYENNIFLKGDICLKLIKYFKVNI